MERRSDCEILVRLTSTIESVVRVADHLAWRSTTAAGSPAGGARFA
jgi:hypothetical protein